MIAEELNEYGRPCLFILDFELQQPLIWPLDQAPHDSVWYDLHGKTNLIQTKIPSSSFYFQKYPISLEAFEQKFNYVHQQLLAGNPFLANLTARTLVDTNLTFQEIFLRSQAKYKLWVSKPNQAFVCFSPETFVRIVDNQIFCQPMKGTIDADLPNAYEQVLADQKEEHATIVDLIRNDLAQVITGRWVERFRYIDRIPTNNKTLLQVSSKIKGRLPQNWQEELGTLLLTLFRRDRLRGLLNQRLSKLFNRLRMSHWVIIPEFVGIFDGNTLDSGVMIRFLERTPEGIFFRSGARITFLSDA
ncbi:MAG: aminodeoxychorismate synthase component I [Siphonobacter sp.]